MKLCSQIKSENKEKYLKGSKTIMKIEKHIEWKTEMKKEKKLEPL